MNNDQERQKRIDDLVRLNNKKYKEEKAQEEQKQFFQKLTQKQGRHKLKEYAKHIQQVNQKRIKLLKERDPKKAKRKDRKKEKVIGIEINQEEKGQGMQVLDNEEEMKSRRRRNSLEIEQINKKVQEMAHQELKRIKSGKLLVQTEKEMKKMKLKELDERRKQILAKTKKVSIFSPPQNCTKQNLDSNIDQQYHAARKMASKNKQESILNKLIKDGSYSDYPDSKKKQMFSIIQQKHYQQDIEQQEEEQQQEQQSSGQSVLEEQDESFKYNQIYITNQKQYYQQQECRVAPNKLDEKSKVDIAKLLNESSSSQEQQMELSPQKQINFGSDDDIFKLSSDQLFKIQYLKI